MKRYNISIISLVLCIGTAFPMEQKRKAEDPLAGRQEKRARTDEVDYMQRACLFQSEGITIVESEGDTNVGSNIGGIFTNILNVIAPAVASSPAAVCNNSVFEHTLFCGYYSLHNALCVLSTDRNQSLFTLFATTEFSIHNRDKFNERLDQWVRLILAYRFDKSDHPKTIHTAHTKDIDNLNGFEIELLAKHCGIADQVIAIDSVTDLDNMCKGGTITDERMQKIKNARQHKRSMVVILNVGNDQGDIKKGAHWISIALFPYSTTGKKVYVLDSAAPDPKFRTATGANESFYCAYSERSIYGLHAQKCYELMVETDLDALAQRAEVMELLLRIGNLYEQYLNNLKACIEAGMSTANAESAYSNNYRKIKKRCETFKAYTEEKTLKFEYIFEIISELKYSTEEMNEKVRGFIFTALFEGMP